MMRTVFVRTSIAAVAVLSVMAAPRIVSATTTDGVITEVELRDSPRHVTVRNGAGEQVQIRVANRTNVDFGAVDQGFFSPELSSLKPGMEVQATYDGAEPATRIHVTSVPAALRHEANREFERSGRLPAVVAAERDSGREELKVKLLDVNRRDGTFRADVAGTSRRFRAESPKLLATFEEGDVVIVRVNDDVVTDVRSSAMVGRVVDLDNTAGVVRIEVGGRVESFKAGRIQALRLHPGDRIRFQVEERETGERVITKVERN